MTNILPTNIPIPVEAAIASYDYYDIAEGTGIKKFYGYVTKDSAGLKYYLGIDAVYSSLIETVTAAAEYPGYNIQLDLDFDLTPFNLPRIIKGTALINQAMHVFVGTKPSVNAYIIYKVRKWDGTTETEIASIQTETITGIAEKIFSIPITIPKTHFKKGEILRLSVQIYAAIGDPGTGTGGGTVIGHDPKNRDGTYLTPSTDDTITLLEFYCPFSIDL